MTESALDLYRQKLQGLASQLTGEVASLEHEALLTPAAAAGDSSPDQADPGALAGDEEVAMALLASEGHTLADVNAALARIAQGTYGQCVACDRAISPARLDAVPYAKHCIQCARKNEAGTVV